VKRWFLEEPHGVIISQKTAFLIFTAVKTSNLTSFGGVYRIQAYMTNSVLAVIQTIVYYRHQLTFPYNAWLETPNQIQRTRLIRFVG
jgi:hypothetical protein